MANSERFTSEGFEDRTRQAWQPPAKVSAVEWCPANVRMPAGSEHGEFDFNVAPHTRGMLELWDDDFIREIYLCWATRNMKTTTMISLMMCAAVNTPRPAAFAAHDEKGQKKTYERQILPMLERCDATNRLLPAPNRRSADAIKLKRCRVEMAHGGSPGSVAGYPACYVFCTEFDKWPHRKQREANAALSIKQRTKGFPYDYKFIAESTPEEKATSRIWSLITASSTDHRQYWVPCPLCGKYQLLEMERIDWEREPNGTSHPLRAEETAVYRCQHCEGAIHDEDRADMMRAGRWLSDGQTISKSGKISGPGKRSPYVGLGPLSSLYSLLIGGWGQLAGEYVRAELAEKNGDREAMKDFQTQTLALPWDPKPPEQDPAVLFAHMGSTQPIHICPEWASFLTRGVDVQQHFTEFPYEVSAWGPGGRGGMIDYGVCHGEEELSHNLQHAEYEHADSGEPLKPVITLIDSGDGNTQDDVYRFCGSRPLVNPIKGSSSPFPKTYKLTALEEYHETVDLHRKVLEGETVLFIANTNRSQHWLQARIDGDIARDHDMFFSLPAEAELDEDLLRQLMDEFEINGKWQRRRKNDLRDAVRYSWIGAMFFTNHGTDWNEVEPRQPRRVTTKARRSRRRRGGFAAEGGGRQ